MVFHIERNKDNSKRQHSDFSIDHILNRAGSCSSENESMDEEKTSLIHNLNTYSWLQCTRYRPPKVSRTNKKDAPQKRQLGIHPRIPFTNYQISVLEQKFQQSPYLSSKEVIELSKELDISDIRVKIWFQNRRARERRERSSTPTNCNNTNSPNKLKEVDDVSSTDIKTEYEDRITFRNTIVSSLAISSNCEKSVNLQENRTLSNPLFYNKPFNYFLQNYNIYFKNCNTFYPLSVMKILTEECNSSR